MKSVVIVQARMASKRLPGKVLLQLNGRSVLSHVIERCQAIRNADEVCCAISESSNSDLVAAEAERCGITVFRGSENDVLDRYYHAATWLKADVILRVTSDCPMLDPKIAEQVIDLRAKEKADFATNNQPPTWPHGLDCEAFSYAWLERAWKEAVKVSDREHVSPFIRRHPEVQFVNLTAPSSELTVHRWTLDYPEDLQFIRALFAVLPPAPPIPSMTDILLVLESHPEIMKINRMHRLPEALKR